MLLSSSWAIFIRVLVFLFHQGPTFLRWSTCTFRFYQFFNSFLFSTKEFKQKNNYIIIKIEKFRLSIDTTSINFFWYNKSATFFSYSIRNYNAMISEIWTKDNMWQKVLGEVLKRFFVTVEIYRHPGWNIFRNLINGVWNKNVLGRRFSKN